MPRISINVASHQFNVDPSVKLVKQKRRKLGPERAKVECAPTTLLAGGFIREVKYLEWLANTVVVNKIK